MLIEIAIRAKIPMISASTTDLLNVQDVLAYLSKVKPKHVGQGLTTETWVTLATQKQRQLLYTSLWPHFVKAVNATEVYKALVASESTLVLLNCPADRRPDECFEVGFIPVPKQVLLAFLQATEIEPEVINEIMQTFGGLTLKQVSELIRLCWTENGYLSARGLREIRKTSIGPTRGLAQVSTDLKYYKPDEALAEWATREKPYFLSGADHRLVPRGVLLGGLRGTGKTLGAKYVADYFGVPLYRLDLGAIKGRYVGESENALNGALSQIDNEEPAVLLIDEVEKLFSTRIANDSGVSQNLLATVLWWLAEHRSRVLTVMTCNVHSAIPVEMIREGRIDRVFMFDGLETGAAIEFAKWYGGSFDVQVKEEELGHKLAKVTTVNGKFSQAQVVQVVHDLVKEQLSVP